MRARALAWPLMLLAAAAAAGQAVAIDSRGRRITLAEPAARVVCLSPGAVETLFAMGAGSRIEAVGSDCDYPSESLAVPVFDEGMAEGADLVIVDLAHRLPADLEAAVRPRLFVYEPKDFRELADATMALGRLVGLEKAGIATAARITDSLLRVRRVVERLHSSDFPRIFWQSRLSPLETCGSATFAQSLISEAGGKNVFADRNGESASVGLRELSARAPAIIVVASPVTEPVELPGFAGRIVRIDASAGARAGPRSASVLLALARDFHPGLIP